MEVPEYLIKAIIRHYGILVKYYESQNRDHKLLVNAYNAKRLAKQELKALSKILNNQDKQKNMNKNRHG